MPTYQYACKDCDHRFEAVQAFSDASLTECPVCHGHVRKVYGSVGVVFKGSGFYRTDSRSGASKASVSSGSKSEASNGASSGGSDGSSGSSTPAGTSSGTAASGGSNGAATSTSSTGSRSGAGSAAPAKAAS